MPTRNLPLPDQLSINTGYTQVGRARLVEFGDGYIQRTPLGINNKVRQIVVLHEGLSSADAATVLAVYDLSQASGDAVLVSANQLLTTSGKFYIQEVNVEMADNERRDITAQMIEVFDL